LLFLASADVFFICPSGNSQLFTEILFSLWYQIINPKALCFYLALPYGRMGGAMGVVCVAELEGARKEYDRSIEND
jgi:hypothetical protein